jgi:hypothetical protein
MYSKTELKALKQEFWTSFGKSFPHDWTLYNTKIKGVEFKFHFDNKTAMVCLDIDHNLEERIGLWEKLIALKTVIIDDYIPYAIFNELYFISEYKDVSRIYLKLENVTINNKATWQETMVFLSKGMLQFELFFKDFKEYLES